jgi:RNA polymerase sigma-70 factor (ECF subfamily)
MVIDRSRLHDEEYRTQVITELVTDYQDRIFRYCVTRLGPLYGEEVAQEVFLTAWESLLKFRQDAPIETWLIGIARYKCYQALRNRARRRAIAGAFLEDIRQQAHVGSPEGPEQMLAGQAQWRQLADGLAQLQDDARILLNLRYNKGLPIPEIAELAGKSEAAVRKRLLRALRRLRRMLDTAAIP